MNLINKKARGKILSLYWFVILTLIAGGVFMIVYPFYSTPYDVRKIEAKILMDNVADCLSYAGEINPLLISSGIVNDLTNFIEKCNLNFGSENEEYYLEANFYKLDDLENPVIFLNKGNNNLISYCEMQSEKDYTKLPVCLKKSFYSVDDSNNQYIIKIVTVVRKLNQNVKI